VAGTRVSKTRKQKTVGFRSHTSRETAWQSSSDDNFRFADHPEAECLRSTRRRYRGAIRLIVASELRPLSRSPAFFLPMIHIQISVTARNIRWSRPPRAIWPNRSRTKKETRALQNRSIAGRQTERHPFSQRSAKDKIKSAIVALGCDHSHPIMDPANLSARCPLQVAGIDARQENSARK